MFDFSFSEMMLVGAVALLVLGPERLPKVAHKIGQLTSKARQLVNDLKGELTKNGELTDLKKLQHDINQTAQQLRQEIHDLQGNVATQHIPAWDKLPEQRTPADFGITESPYPSVYGFSNKSLRKQALSRQRDARPKYRPKPKLRLRK